MRFLEVRRHAPTKKGDVRTGSQLSPEGVRLARQLGEDMGPFDHVVVSDIPRSLETALAMGFAVDEVTPELCQLSSDFWEEVGRHDHWTWPNPFSRYRELIAQNGPVAAAAARQIEVWRTALEAVSDGGAVLIISHGHAMEAAFTACFAIIEPDSIPRPFSHGEGFRAQYKDGAFHNPQLRRVKQ